MKAKLLNKKRYNEKVQMKKTIKAHQEKKTKGWCSESRSASLKSDCDFYLELELSSDLVSIKNVNNHKSVFLICIK
jgi:hypothetical protein